MAYAYCPRCHKSFRYKAASVREPAWLRAAVRAGAGDDRVVMPCIACWVVPAAGDPVIVLERPFEPSELKPGWLGTVIDTDPTAFDALVHVHGVHPTNGRPWCHWFRRHQLQAALSGAGGTLVLSDRNAFGTRRKTGSTVDMRPPRDVSSCEPA